MSSAASSLAAIALRRWQLSPGPPFARPKFCGFRLHCELLFRPVEQCFKALSVRQGCQDPDVISNSAAISACEKGGLFTNALELLDEIAVLSCVLQTHKALSTGES